MNKLLSLGILCVTLAATKPVFADLIPYPNKGTVAPTENITATGSGIVVYFAGSNATDNDTIEIIDLTSHYNSGAIFPNQSTTVDGTGFTLGVGSDGNGDLISAGDHLEFLVIDSTVADTFSSIPGDSADGINHVFTTPFSGGDIDSATGEPTHVSLPAGTYVGFEDRSTNAAQNGGNGASDLDYNDDSFVFTNVSSSVAPEPSSIALLGTGILAVAGSLRRRIKA